MKIMMIVLNSRAPPCPKEMGEVKREFRGMMMMITPNNRAFREVRRGGGEGGV